MDVWLGAPGIDEHSRGKHYSRNTDCVQPGFRPTNREVFSVQSGYRVTAVSYGYSQDNTEPYR